AARTLGRIYPYPEPAVAALAKMLGGKEVAERRAAAEALAALAQLVEGQARNRVNGGSLLEWTVPEIVQRGQLLTVAAGRGLGDSDALVKRHCLAALQATAKTMHALLGELPKREDFPPTGRKATPAEQQQLVALEGQLVEVRKQLKPLIEALNEVVKPSAALLNDPEADVVQAACAALEELAATRQRGRQREAAFAAILQVANLKPPAIPLLDPLSQTVPALAGVLAHPEVRVRLGALYVLETLEAEAVAATPALVKACGDGDAFVRWGAARALGKLAPAESKAVVPALGKLASDPNGDVRITALAALERFGPSAAAAVAALGPVAAKGDVPTRLWAMRALAAIGKEAQGAVPSLTTALAATEPAVREAAARTLGKVGHGSAEARKVLRQALDDANGDVQEAAAQALLNLQ
ncbi:MAG: HEAT repeat domain-containing protein, partial [Planctomycetia bacterium]|nr:HEAT repeat domain-containing protein [Planctomycetia bacterium]